MSALGTILTVAAFGLGAYFGARLGARRHPAPPLNLVSIVALYLAGAISTVLRIVHPTPTWLYLAILGVSVPSASLGWWAGARSHAPALPAPEPGPRRS